MQIRKQRINIPVANKLTNSRLRHSLQNKLGDPGMTKQMGVERETTLVRVILNCMLKRIGGKRAAPSDAFEGNKDLINFREKIPTFFIQVLVQSSKGERVHVNR